MSYELGAVSRPGRYSPTTPGKRRRVRRMVAIGGKLSRGVPASRTIQRRRARRQLPSNYTLVGYRLNEASDGLGFSLKPPKKVRKVFRAIKKNVTLKRVLVAGAVVGGAVIAGPAILAAARKAAPAIGRTVASATRGLVKGGRDVVGGVVGLLRGGSHPNPPDNVPQDMSPQPQIQPMGPQTAMQASAMRAAAAQADVLDTMDERDPGPLVTVDQNGEPVDVAAQAPKEQKPQPSVAPLAIGGGLLWLLSRL